MNAERDRDLTLLPKAHLHLHLEGAMRPATLAELAAGHRLPVPDVRDYAGFAEFGLRYAEAAALIRTEGELRRVVREVVEDAARDGAVWLEPSVYPPAHAERLGVSAGHVLDIMIDEADATAARLGIGCGLMVSALRHLPPDGATALARLAVSRAGRGVGGGVVSFGLAADEALFPPEPFAEAFAVARDGGLLSAPHAGELAGPASVLGALDALGARRLGHGVRAVEDPALVERLAADEVTLDVCPTSNALLGVVGSLADHPLPRLLAAGVRCSIGADDPLLFGPGLLAEYETARRVLGLADERLAEVARASLEGSAAPPEVVAAGLRRIAAWL
jgi:adenosine deaminase